MSVVSKSHHCPYRSGPHENLAYVEYFNGHWCYSCNRGEFKNDSYYAFRKQPLVQKTGSELVIPINSQSIKDFSLETRAWLYKHYVFDDLIYKSSIKYCPYVYYTTASGQIFEGESLLFPIVCDREIVAYQQRFFPNKQFFSKEVKKHIFDAGNHDTGTVVLVEDYISAIRVGEIENCVWLQGTTVSQELHEYLIKTYTHIKIWLDGDEAGQQAAAKIYKTLENKLQKEVTWGAFAVREQRTLRNIVTEQDPKCYSNQEIREVLEC